MVVRSCIAFLLAVPAAGFAQISPASLNQPVTFELHLAGKPVGKDVYTITKSKQGYKLASHLEGKLHNSDLDFKDSISYTDDFSYLDFGQVAQGTNQQISYLLSKDHKEMTIAVVAAGRTSSSPDPINPTDALVVLPPFDAGAAQALLSYAVSHPTPQNHLSVYLTPGYSLGGGRPDPNAPPAPADDTLPPGVHCFTAVWLKGAPLTGTLGDKPVTVNSYALAFGKARFIFFADQDNNLMQVNVSLLHGSYIRENFKLDPPKQAMPR
jgi:hypothetical protein